MRLRDKVVVPELSPSAQTRVERGFIEAVRSGAAAPDFASAFRRGFATLAVGIAIAGVAVAIAINPLDGRAIVSAPVNAKATEIATSADGVTLRLGDASIEVGPESELTLIRNVSGEIGVALRRGQVNCNVEPRPNRPTFWVGASDVTVTVVGTVFSVSHDPELASADKVRVGVERGRVAVSAAGSEVLVSAGSQWSARDGVTRAVAAAQPVVPAQPDNADAAIGAAAGSSDVKEKDAKRTARGASKTPRAKPEKATATKKTEKATMPRARRLSAPGDDEELLAVMALDSSDPREAVRLYTQIATRERGRRASFALYSRAYVEYVRLGDRSAALRTLDLFRRRFPRAREAESALWLQILALCKSGQDERCRSAAHSYSSRYPSGRFASAAQKIIDTL